VTPDAGSGSGRGARAAGGPAAASAPVPDTAALLALVEQLSRALERSDLVELEVEAGGTGILLRKPAAIAAPGAAPVAAAGTASGPVDAATEPELPAVRAPLTGIFYSAPAPGSAPYVSVGSQIAVGQVIGLIEAMKLFNEIKSDLAGRVVRIVPDSGTLVKAKQALIEVEPL
jgi:acetyl-CoA carboxylase biotin carboxyl carrier protein